MHTLTERALDTAASYGLAVGVVAGATAALPLAALAGVVAYVTLHHTPAGKAWFAQWEALNADQDEAPDTTPTAERETADAA